MKSILTKLVTLQLLGGLLATAVLWFICDQSLKSLMSSSFIVNGQTITESIANATEGHLVRHDLTSVQSVLDASLKIPNIEWIYVTSPNGQVLAHTFVPVFPTTLPRSGLEKSWTVMRMPETNRPVTAFTQPVLKGIVGAVHVGFAQEHLLASIAREEFLLLATTMGIMLLMTAVITLPTRRIIAPVTALTRAAAKLQTDKTGAFEALPVSTRDEIGVLTETFNRMVGEINAYQKSLEARVTDLSTANEALEEAKTKAEAATRTKGEFLANVSHEIRTPMNGVLGMTELLLDTELTVSQRESLSIVKNSAESLLTIINDVLDFSKIEAGKLDLDLISFDLRNNLEETLKLIAFQAHEKGLELICDVDSNVPHWIIGDPTRIRQVVLNLIGNAVKFTSHGEVVVEVRLDKQENTRVCLHFNVRDTGIGIPLTKQKVIFEAFSQADGSTTRKFGGTGLGLTISARLVEAMGGRIWVESELGRGSCFHFTVTVDILNELASSQRYENDRLVGAAVLVVDDNATSRRVISNLLQSWGMMPVAAESAEEALTHLRFAGAQDRQFALVVSDIGMPETDGYGLAERMGRTPGLTGLPTLLLTSGNCRDTVTQSRSLEVTGLVAKPIRHAELRARISGALSGQNGCSEDNKQAPSVQHRLLLTPKAPVARILLAEDNLVNQRVALRTLEKAGHSVVIVNNGREAFAAVQEKEFDIVLMDVQMPEMDGFEATAAIREREGGTGARVPIIALTAHAMRGDAERCIAAGMDGYLTKPIRMPELVEQMEKHLSVLSSHKPLI